MSEETMVIKLNAYSAVLAFFCSENAAALNIETILVHIIEHTKAISSKPIFNCDAVLTRFDALIVQ